MNRSDFSIIAGWVNEGDRVAGEVVR